MNFHLIAEIVVGVGVVAAIFYTVLGLKEIRLLRDLRDQILLRNMRDQIKKNLR